MKRREDWKILKGLKKIGVDVNDLTSKPLLALKKDDKMTTLLNEFEKHNGFDDNIKIGNLFKHLTTNAMLNSVGDSFLLLSSGYYENETLCLINYNKESETFSVALLSIDGDAVGSKDKIINMKVDKTGVSISEDDANHISMTVDEPNELIKLLARNAGIKATLIIGLFNILENSDLYPVEKINVSTKKIKPHIAKQKPWMREDLVSIVFLNQLPREQSESKGGHHASPRYHHRRGAWVHLSNERYKNHPKYGDKIYRKASWVGKREAIVNGTTYKVL